MCRADEVERALAYFTDPHHLSSFELLPGAGRVLLSAPHAVLQTRGGRIKQAERYTGMLCRLLNAHAGCPCIYKSRHLGDDANYDSVSDYRDALCAYASSYSIRYVLDLHQLAPSRPMALCIGTGRGRNLNGDERAVLVLRNAFSIRRLIPVTLDDPFAALREHTVCATAAGLGVAALLLELNTGLLIEGEGSRFMDVMDALYDAIAALNAD